MPVLPSQSSRRLLLAIHERQTRGERWVEIVELRTTDPATEEYRVSDHYLRSGGAVALHEEPSEQGRNRKQ